MDWSARLRHEGIRHSSHDHELVYHAALRPAVPPEFDVGGLVGITWRLGRRHDGARRYATGLDLAAAVRLGRRLGLEPGEAVAFVDSHERVHVAAQLSYDTDPGGEPAPEVEEEHSRFVDAVWLSLRHPRAEALLTAGEFGLVTEVHHTFWEALVDVEQA